MINLTNADLLPIGPLRTNFHEGVNFASASMCEAHGLL